MDSQYMKIALDLAKKGYGNVNPNPMVGALIVKDGNIIGKGYHQAYGQPHAEPNAVNSCSISPKGSTLYVTLEPCCHFGKTPPCTDVIINSGITRVVIGSLDPNPLVSGKSIEILQSNGIAVTCGVLEDECNQLNRVFFHFIKTKMPYVTMKYAITLDGKIATYSGNSKWITGEKAREKVHMTRYGSMGIMVGVGTVLADNPSLDCRLSPEQIEEMDNYTAKNPIRIICDTNLRIPMDSKIVKTAKDIPTIIATSTADDNLCQKYIHAGCQILKIPLKGSHLDIGILMEKLGELKIDSILLEGGGTLNWSAIESGVVSAVQAYMAPKIFGGSLAKSPIMGNGVPMASDAIRLKNMCVSSIGEDILIESEVENNVHRNY